MDPLSDVLSLLKLKGMLSARLECAGSWAFRFPAYRHLKFGNIHSGSLWIWIEAVTEPICVEEGDFYLITDGMPYCLASDPNAEVLDGVPIVAEKLGPDRIVRYGNGDMRVVGTGGSFTVDDELRDLLLKVLPPIIHIQASSEHAKPLRSTLDLIEYETSLVRPGAGVLAQGLANIVLVNILRVHLAVQAHTAQTHPASWLSALKDLRIGTALGRMHADVARRWKVEDLASEVGMSRTTFAERFKALVGVPPLEYLIHWRMMIARNALKNGSDTLSDIAASVAILQRPPSVQPSKVSSAKALAVFAHSSESRLPIKVLSLPPTLSKAVTFNQFPRLTHNL